MADGWNYFIEHAGHRHPLETRQMTVGRSRKCDISVPDPSVSRKHVYLTAGGGKIALQDLGSSNGTFLNGERIEGSTVLNHGTTLELGDAVLQIIVEAEMPTSGGAAIPQGEGIPQMGEATSFLQAASVRLAQDAMVNEDPSVPSAAEVPSGPWAKPPSAPSDAAQAPSPPAAEAGQVTMRLDPSQLGALSPAAADSSPGDMATGMPKGMETTRLDPSQFVDPTPAAPQDAGMATTRLDPSQFNLTPPSASTPPAAAPAGAAPVQDVGMATTRLDPSQFNLTPPAAETAPATPDPAPPAPAAPAPAAPPQDAGMATTRLDPSQFDLENLQTEVKAPPMPDAGMATTRLDPSQLAASLPDSGLPVPAVSVPEASVPAPPAPVAPEIQVPDVGMATTRLDASQLEGLAEEPPTAALPTVAPAAPTFEAPAAPTFDAPAAPTFEAPATELPSFEPPESGLAAPTSAADSFGGLMDESLSGYKPPAADAIAAPPVDLSPPPVAAPPVESPPSFDAPPVESPPPVAAPPVESPPSFDAPPAFDAPPTFESLPSFESPPTFEPAPSVAPPPPAAPSGGPDSVPSQDVAPPPEAPLPDAAPSFNPPPPSPPMGVSSPPLEFPDLSATGGGGLTDIRNLSLPHDPDSETPRGNELLPSLDGFDTTLGPGVDVPEAFERAQQSMEARQEVTEEVPQATAQYNPYQRTSGAEPPRASFWIRALAVILDGVWMGGLSAAAYFFGNNQLIGLGVLGFNLLIIVVCWSVWGQTPGKKIVGVYVCTKEGKPGIGFVRALIRLAGYLVSSAIFGIGFLLALGEDKRTLHDRIAGTYVRRIR